ncbi:MAG: hypothetical protein LBV11_08830 [Bacillus cereus]|jgi:hypothetical protein|nr:hypothetical protein [Bacillus cereus]
MKKLFLLLLILPLLVSCSGDNENEFVNPNLPVDESIAPKDIVGKFTMYNVESKDDFFMAGEYADCSLTFEIEGYGFDELIHSYKNGFSWTLEKGIISFKFDNNQNYKGYFSKDKWGLLLIVVDGSAKKYYRNYNPINFLTSIKINKITEDVNINKSYKLNVSYSPSDLSYINFTWLVSDLNLANITNGELVTRNNSGQVKILVQAGEHKDSIYVDIKEPKGYKFGYKFGSSIADIKPQVKISGDFAYNYATMEESLKAFKFSNDKLISIWSCYDSYYNFGTNEIGNRLSDSFLREVNSLNPPKDTFSTDEEGHLLFENDSITWKYQDFNILMRKGIIPIREQDVPFHIIEYSQAQ